MSVPNTYAEVSEETTSVLSIAFFAEDDTAVIPTAVSYSIIDAASSTSIVALTSLTGPFSTTLDIEITAAQNAILNTLHTFEMRVVTIEFDYSGSKHSNNEYRYMVKNLSGIS
jgi:hypothetical protein